VDVVGPENGDNIVLAAFSTTDGGESYPEPT
jgi:hypothetical protein